MPECLQKNGNTIFSSRNQNAKSGFETDKHLFFSNSSLNSDILNPKRQTPIRKTPINWTRNPKF
jgi:hypothetical protein